MSDPYRSYRPGRGEPRYDYPPEDHYYDQPPYGGRGSIPEPYDRSYRDPYARESAPIPPAPGYGAPRGDYRAPPPIRAEPDYSRRGDSRGYAPPPPPPGARGSVGDPYSEPGYYPPQDRERHSRAPPPRDPYDRSYPPEPAYRDERGYSRRRPREEEYDMPGYNREYEYNYEPEPPAAQRRPPPPIEYRGGAAAPYEVEPPRSSRRAARDPAAKIPSSMPSQPSPESGDEEFTLPAEGIRKEVLQKYITRFLGNDAVSRGPMKEGDIHVYKYVAYRQFTTEQIRDLKRASELYEPGYARGMDPRTREPPGPAITSSSSRPGGRRNTDEDSMMIEPGIPREEYIYTAGNQGTRAPAREIRAGRSPHDPPYGTSYHDPARHGRPPIEASAMRPDDDDEMEG